jgi:hypothetical protein
MALQPAAHLLVFVRTEYTLTPANLYLAQQNLEPKRYVWHADGEEV